jgi:hypothetical protein
MARVITSNTILHMDIRTSCANSNGSVGGAWPSLALHCGGAAAIFWALSVLPYFNVERDIRATADMVRRGEAFSPSMADVAAANLAADVPYLRASMLPYAEIIGVMNFEHAGANPSSASASKFVAFTKANLARNPTDGLAWLSLFWLDTLSGQTPTARAYDYLRMSYRQMPNEGWIAEKRNSLVLRYFTVLPADISAAAVGEFVHLVRSYLYNKAAEIFVGASPDARNALSHGLEDLPADQLAIFAAALRERQPEATREKSAPRQ